MKYIVLLLHLFTFLYAGDSTQFSAFKQRFRLANMFSIVRPSDVTYQLWEGFSLVRKANSGDPEALHELGIRYLAGQGFPADSAKSFELIKRAADNGHLLALFNTGVFFHNGWGIHWDPYNAFRYFQAAARKGVREGAFAYSLYYTDNLTVQRDYEQAAHWMRISAEGGYPPAKELLPEIERLRSQARQDSIPAFSSTQTAQTPLLEPLPLDFEGDIEQKVEKEFVLREVMKALGDDWKTKIDRMKDANDSTLFLELAAHADWGIPEEYTILGRCYESGIGVPRDSLKALLMYIRAVRLESRRAPALLIRLLDNAPLITALQQKANRGDPESQYIISCFALTEIFPMQRKEDIVLFLQRSSQLNYIPAITEFGSAYFSGQLVTQDKQKGIDLWNRAAVLGSKESMIRLASAKILTGFGTMGIDSALSVLQRGASEGSLIAQMSIGFYYEQSGAASKNYALAVKMYRTAMQRGSRTAYASLQRIYDAMRPDEKEFRIISRD